MLGERGGALEGSRAYIRFGAQSSRCCSRLVRRARAHCGPWSAAASNFNTPEGRVVTLRVRCVRGRVRSQCVVYTLLERRVRSGTAEGFETETHPPVPVGSRGRAGSEAAAWFAR